MKEVLNEPRFETPTPNMPRKRKHVAIGRISAAFILVLLIAAAVVAVGRISESRALGKETEAMAVPTVATIHPRQEPPNEELVLPATLQAYTESPIYARTNGYLLKWYKDIGAKVSKGDLLADIDTPELDQEIMQARAARDQAMARQQLAKTSAQRWEGLRKTDAVSQQETDERTSGYTQAEADVAAANANLRRLEQLESFKHIYAPFSGVLTKRNVDIGALINAGNGGMNHELFDIAQVSPIRVYVDAPQTYAPAIRPGLKAKIQLSELAGEQFQGEVVRTADAIDPATRTLRTEIDVPNPKGTLLPGAYAQVALAVKPTGPRITIPVNAMLFRREVPQAVVLGSDGKVHLKKITIGRDFGTSVEVIEGVSPNDTVVLNPSDSLEEGQTVNAQPEQKQS